MDSAVNPVIKSQGQIDHMVFYSYINQLFVVRQKRIFRADDTEEILVVFITKVNYRNPRRCKKTTTAPML